MSLDLPRFFRNAPEKLLRPYLETMDADAFKDIDWLAKDRARNAALLKAVDALDSETHAILYGNVERIMQFSKDHGRGALRSVLNDPEAREIFDAIEGVEGCALYVLARHPDLFEHALASHFAQRRLNGGDWTGLEFGGDAPLVVEDEGASQELAERLRDILKGEGPRPRVAIEHFTRHEVDPITGNSMSREQYTVYVEGPPEAMTTFDERTKPERRIVRPVHHSAIIIDGTERTLDIVARGGKEIRQRIAEAFVGIMLKPGPTLARRARRTLALDKLKAQTTFPTTPEDRVERVETIGLLLGAPDFRSTVAYDLGRGGDDPHTEDFHTRAQRDIGTPLKGAWRVLSAKVRITFEPEGPKARRKRVTLELKAPDRTNLRDQIEHHRRIADVLLERWGLYVGAVR